MTTNPVETTARTPLDGTARRRTVDLPRRRLPRAVVRPPARGPLRVATFNVGLMSTFIEKWDRADDPVGAVTEGFVNLFLTDEDAVRKGDQLADRILAAPYDVVVLNELFHADARAQLARRLTDPGLPDGVRYPWVRHGFGPEERVPPGNPQPMPWDLTPDWGPFPDIDADFIGALRSLLDDSGLFIASRLRLESFVLEGRSTDWGFCRYSASRGIDTVAPKGAGAVVVREPGGSRRCVVTFTHLQADYAGDPTNADVRALQLEQLAWLTRGVGAAADAGDVLIMGDLNIRGEVPSDDAATHTSEWAEVFGPGGSLTSLGVDGWLEGACGPAGPAPAPAPGWFDREISHADDLASTTDDQRLDYVVAGELHNGSGQRRGLGVQHLMIATNLHDGVVDPQRGTPIGLAPVDLSAPRGELPLSDHYGVNAILGQRTQASSPSTAVDGTPVLAPGAAGAERSWSFADVEHGALRWLALQPGAYRIAVLQNFVGTGRPVDLQVFDPTDLSASLVDLMPPDASPVAERRGVRYPAVDHPLLVRLHSFVTAVHDLDVTVRLILGATPDDAVPLSPWMPTAPMSWPTPAQGGDPLRARWFEVLLKSPDPAQEQTVTFHASTPDGRAVDVRFDVFWGTSVDQPPVDPDAPGVSLADGTPHLVTGTSDPDRRFLVRAVPAVAEQDTETVVEVRSDLCFLEGAGYTALDETGPDWGGADEIEWSVQSDLVPAATTGSDGDVDTNESYPMVGRMPFRDRIDVVIAEDGGLAGDERATFVLPGGSPADQKAMHTATLPDDLKDGTYGVVFTWTRRLRNSA